MGVPLPWRLESRIVLDVAVPLPRRAPSGAGVRGRALTLREGDVRVRNGLRVSSPSRTWCDLGAELDLLDLVAAGDFLIHHRGGVTTRRHLERAVESHTGRRGRPRLLEALPLLDSRSESRQESHLRVILMRGGIPGLAINLPITTSGGFRYRVDLGIPSRRAVIEYQSDYHGDMVRFRRDMTRRGRLEADRWLVILVNIDDLRSPHELVKRIRGQLDQRELRPI
jgi:very-short-patch-repair endonuclease